MESQRNYKVFKSKTVAYKILLLIIMGVVLNACSDKCETTVTFKYHKPVYKPFSEVRSEVSFGSAREIVNPGKIYISGNYLFINEKNEGIHVVDNSDKSNPQNVSFINIPGNFDIAAFGNFLYADSYVDILTFYISDPLNIQLLHRLENALPVFEFHILADPELGVITGWEEEETVQVMEGCENILYPPGYVQCFGDVLYNGSLAAFASSESLSYSKSGAGVGGSMARFTVNNKFLYAVSTHSMHLFDITNESGLKPHNTIYVGWGLETVYPYKDKLFLGAQNGMHIYDNSNPGAPKHLSTFMHFTACDPVVVEDNLAYVTLRSGTTCWGVINELQVVNISDLYNPKLERAFQMGHPHGVGIDKGTLFLCDGEFGLKIFDAQEVVNEGLKDIKMYPNLHAYDVIPFNNILMMIGDDGFYQFDYSDLSDVKLLGKISVNRVQN